MEAGVGSETILLVDRDPETRKLGAFMLQKRGYTVLEARTTADALRLYESMGARADLLLTEVMMPQVSGPALAKQLLALQPGLRVLYMSDAGAARMGRYPEIDRRRDLLQKPFTMGMLMAKVRQTLGASQASTAGSAG
jgi:DNA-binding NtrC family response regulator